MDSSLTNDGMGGRVLLATERAFFSTNLLMSCGAGDGTGLAFFSDLVDSRRKWEAERGHIVGDDRRATAPEIDVIE